MALNFKKSFYQMTLSKKNIKKSSLHELLDSEEIEGIRFFFKEYLINKPSKSANFLSNDRDAEGQLPIHKAFKSSNVEIVRLFIDFYKKNPNYVDINTPDSLGYTPLHNIVCNVDLEEGHEFIKEILNDFPDLRIDTVNKESNTALHYLCGKYNSPHAPELVEIMIKKVGSLIVNARNKTGETPLHKAIFNGSVRLLLVELLINYGANVNAQNSLNESPLHYAVRLGRKDLISVLVRAGASIDLKGAQDKTPLDLCHLDNSIKSHLIKLKELIEWGNRENISQDVLNIFIKEELFLDTIQALDEEMLKILGVDTFGARRKILNSVQRLSSYKLNEVVNTDSGLILEMPKSVKSEILNPLDDDNDFQIEETIENPENIKGLLRTRDEEGNINQKLVDDWIINNDIEFLKKLGEGVSGKVFKGLFKGQECAIKVLKSRGNVEEFKKEFMIISSVRSPHIVRFFGACLSPQIAMVMEYCSKGSLFDVLQDTKINVEWSSFFKWTFQMCKAVQTLHSWTPLILHRDLKSLNLLVNERYDVFLADFGLSRFETESNADTLMKTCGTVIYCSPEILGGSGKYTIKSDVYSVSFIIWEIVIRVLLCKYMRPYSEYPDMIRDIQFLKPVCDDGLRPTFPNVCPSEITQLIKDGWNQLPDKRPTIEEIIERVAKIESLYEKNKEDWDALVKK